MWPGCRESPETPDDERLLKMHKIELLYLIVISALFLSYIVTVTCMRRKVVNFGDINFCVDIPNPLNPTMQICM